MKEVELINKRKPREKHFLREDGTIVAKIYDSNIHYLKNGKYEEIDNTLIKKNSCYTNKSNEYKVKFPGEVSSSIMKMEKDNYYLDIKLVNAKRTKAQNKKKVSKYISELAYKDILDNIDIKYQNLPTKVKETIILNSKKYKRLIFDIFTNLQLIERDNSIIALEQDQAIFTIEKPYMQDSNGNKNTNIYYNLSKKNGYYNLELILDKKWLTSKDTKFPVYIDPTITNESQSTGLCDTYIYQGDTGIDKSSQDVLKAGIEQINGSTIENKTLIKFDLPEIGTGSQVVGASIILTGYLPSNNHDIAEPKLASIHRITGSWNENEATWDSMNTQFDSKAESLLECERSSVEGTNLLPTTMYGDITNLAKKWYNKEENNGVMIQSVSKEYIDEDYPAFFSKSNTISGDNPKPFIAVTYRNQNGIESYLDYRSQAFSDGTAYVNTYNGNLTTIFNIGHTIGGQLPAKLKLVYNTNDVILENETFFGKGYKLNLEQIIRNPVAEIGSQYLEYIDADGTIHYLYKETENSSIYNDEDGLGLTLEKGDNQCIMKDKSNGQMIFNLIDDTYYLVKINDSDGNCINIERDSNNRINKIKDKYNSEILISYDTNIITITSQDSVTKINILEEKITSIESITGTTSFTYNENNLISSITDITGIKINYEYYSKTPHRIKKVTQYGLNNTLGQFFSLEYGFDTTRIIDSQERAETIIYNSSGNIISRNSLKSNENIDGAYSLVQDFSTSGSTNNKLLANHIPTAHVKNYLKNTSFELDEQYFSNEDEENLILSYSTEESYSGNRSLRIDCLKSGRSIEQYVSVPKGYYYTLSGYFKADEPTDLILMYGDKDGKTVGVTYEIDWSNVFERCNLSIYYPEDATTDLKIIIAFQTQGQLYIDALQLEKGEVANLYNMIENSDFSESLSGWTINAYDESGTEIDANQFFSIVEVNDNKNTALKISMNPLYATSFRKKFKVNGKQDELYTVSFWYKNEGVPACRQHACNSVMINFHPSDGEAEYCAISSPTFNNNDTIWQYFSYSAYALEDFDEIELIFNQNTQINNLYITNVSLFHNITSNFYEYDDKGNLISIKNQNQEKNELKYDDNNQLINAVTSEGKKYYLEYDNEKPDKLLNVMLSNGISNEIKYDSLGNPKATIISKKYSGELGNGQYRIRNKGTRKYLKAELNMVLLEENSCSNTIWNLEKNEDKFRFIYSVQPTYSISHSELAVTLIKGGNTWFNLEQKDNGSYLIYIQEQDKKMYLKGEGAKVELADLIIEDPTFEFYIETINELFIETNATYDEEGKFNTGSIDSNFNSTEYIINPVTNQVTSVTDANGNVINYTYNEQKLLSSVNASNRNVTYSYNEQNLLSEVTQGTRKYKFNYDNFLNPKNIIIGNNIIFTSHEYMDYNGKLKKITYGNNDVISYSYDGFGRVENIIKEDNTYNCKYDNNGNISKIVSSDGTESSYKYDESNRLFEYRYNEYKINYTYNTYDEVTNQKYKLGHRLTHNIENQYDKDQTPVKTIIDGQEFVYEYDAINRLKKQTLPNDYSIQYDYIENGHRVTEIIKNIVHGNNTYSYDYDKLYNITHIYYNNQLVNQYFYDEHSQLIKEENYILNEQIDYSYDSYGNILSKTKRNLTDNKIVKNDTYQYNNSNWEDLLTNYNGTDITYDNIGNPLTIGDNIAMTWVNGNLLNSYTDSSSNLHVTYNYNVNGLRTSRNVNGVITDYYYDGNDIIYEHERNTTNTIYYLYDVSGLIGLEYNGQKYYYIKNLQNDIIGILNNLSEQIVTYEYDSWGNILSIKDSDGNLITDQSNIGLINPYRYRSYYYDSKTKLYYLIFRYYNPEWSRFINADTIIGANKDFISFNLFTYASNNPISLTDASGHGLWDKICKGAKKAKKKIEKGLKTAKKTLQKGWSKAKETFNNVVNYVFGFSVIYPVDERETTVASIPGSSVTMGSNTSISSPVVGSGDSAIHISSDGFGSEIEVNGKYSNVKLSCNNGEIVEISAGINVKDKKYNVIAGVGDFDLYVGYQTETTVEEVSVATYTKFRANIIFPILAVVAIAIPGPTPVPIPVGPVWVWGLL